MRADPTDSRRCWPAGVRPVLALSLALDVLLLCSGFGSKRFALTRDCSANSSSFLGFVSCFRLGFGSHVASAQVFALASGSSSGSGSDSCSNPSSSSCTFLLPWLYSGFSSRGLCLRLGSFSSSTLCSVSRSSSCRVGICSRPNNQELRKINLAPTATWEDRKLRWIQTAGTEIERL